MIGRRFAHYRIIEPVASGGMGVVYRARDEHLDRGVAIKVLPPETSGRPEDRRRFRHEARALSKLNHPHTAVVLARAGTSGSADVAEGPGVIGTTTTDQVRARRFCRYWPRVQRRRCRLWVRLPIPPTPNAVPQE